MAKPVDIAWLLGITIDPESEDLVLVMEHEESDLWTVCLERELTWRQVYNLLIYISSTLASLHKEGITHQDLHPGNILQSSDLYRLSDFGLSGLADMPRSRIYGVLPYIAPEVLRGEPYTAAADVYSFGMVMWTLLSSTPPFHEQKWDAGLLLSIINGERPSCTTPGVPEKYIEIMKRCWDADPSQRPTAYVLDGYFRTTLREEIKTPSFINKIVERNVSGNATHVTKSEIYSVCIQGLLDEILVTA